MPVRKFRSIEEKNAWDEERRGALDPQPPEDIDALLKEWGELLPPPDFPKGVHKFRSIEEMSAFREKYERERSDRLRAERLKK